MKQLKKHLVGASLLLLPFTASAIPMLYVVGGPSTDTIAGGQLATVDLSTGQTNIIGSLGVPILDIAFDDQGNLYGLGRLNSPNPTHISSLYKIDPGNAATTFIGDTGSPGLLSPSTLAFGQGNLHTTDGTGFVLYTVDRQTGGASRVTPIETSAFRPNGHLALTQVEGDMAFNSGNLFGGNDNGILIDLDPSNGDTSILGPLSFDPTGLFTATDGFLYGTSPTGVYQISTTISTNFLDSFLFNFGNGFTGVTGAAFGMGAGTDTGTGTGTGIGTGTGNAGTDPSSVPAPGSLPLMALGLLGLGFVSFRKRNTT